MNGISKRLVETAFSRISLILFALLILSAGNNAIADVYRTAAWGTPTIDGVWSEGEWDNDRIIGFDHGVITFMRDFLRLYVLIDVIDDATEDPPTFTGDTVQVYFHRDECHSGQTRYYQRAKRGTPKYSTHIFETNVLLDEAFRT